MKVVLFCGGLGLRMRDAFDSVPKPLVAIGDRPILWHVMRYYAHHGHREFVLCLGHRGDAIREYFSGLSPADIGDWRITFLETGPLSSIGERLRQAAPHLDGDQTFLANYADGLTDLHLPHLIAALGASDKLGAFLCIKPALSYHFVRTAADGTVTEIAPCDALDLRVNGGYFVFRREIFDYIREGEDLVGAPFHRLIDQGRLLGYAYDGFWMNMDTFKDRQRLEEHCTSGRAPWEVWKPRQLQATGDGSWSSSR